jgi:hypothetical protein
MGRIMFGWNKALHPEFIERDKFTPFFTGSSLGSGY